MKRGLRNSDVTVERLRRFRGLFEIEGHAIGRGAVVTAEAVDLLHTVPIAVFEKLFLRREDHGHHRCLKTVELDVASTEVRNERVRGLVDDLGTGLLLTSRSHHSVVTAGLHLIGLAEFFEEPGLQLIRGIRTKYVAELLEAGDVSQVDVPQASISLHQPAGLRVTDHLATLILFFTDGDFDEATINGLGGLADGETGQKAQQQGCESTHGDMAQERSGAPSRRGPL